MADPAVPSRLVDEVAVQYGRLDIVVAAHARSASQSLIECDAAALDASWAVNVRSVVLLARRLAEMHAPSQPGGRMIWFTSGQGHRSMKSELPYAVTKSALHLMTTSVADALVDYGIIANCINPGPTDTGWSTPEDRIRVREMMPQGRWGRPQDVANLIAFLVSDEGAWICGQVIDSEGGFRR